MKKEFYFVFKKGFYYFLKLFKNWDGEIVFEKTTVCMFFFLKKGLLKDGHAMNFRRNDV